MKTVSQNNQTIYYTVTYKKIKHLYMRYKDGVWYVSSSKKYSESDIKQFIFQKFDQLILKQSKSDLKICLPKYCLFGTNYSKSDFYTLNGFPIDDAYYYQVLACALANKVEKLKPWLVSKIALINLKLVPIDYKIYKSRYGCCHVTKREITLNIFMAKPDEIYLKYVLLHEFAHLKVANHSDKFYRILDKLMVNHYQIQKDLRKIPITFG